MQILGKRIFESSWEDNEDEERMKRLKWFELGHSKRKRWQDDEEEDELPCKKGNWIDLESDLVMKFEEPLEEAQVTNSIDKPMTDLCTGVISLQGKILDCNAKFGQVIGYPREHLLERTVFSIFSELERNNILEHLQKLFSNLANQDSLCFDTNILHSNTQSVALRVMIRPIYDEANFPKALLWIAKPIQKQVSYPERLALTYYNDSQMQEDEDEPMMTS
jgi:PAS domain S-box-containing protein